MEDRVARNHRVEPRDRNPRDLGKEFPDVDEESPTRHPLEGHESRISDVVLCLRLHLNHTTYSHPFCPS